MPGTNTVMALDLGTGSCKGALYTATGRRLAMAASPYPLAFPQPGHVEQDPGDYRRAAQAVCRELMARARGLSAGVAALSFSTQTPTLLLCDEHGEAIAPAIVWQDARAAAEAAELSERYSDDHRRAWFGMDLPMAAASTPAKLLWLARNAPQLWQRARCVLQPKDYIAAILTGNFATDGWCAKGLVHVDTGAVHPEFLEILDRSDSPSPPVLRGDEPVGAITRHAAAAWSLPPGLPVMAGWSDALAGILSTGACHSANTAFVITGTSEIIGMSRRDAAPHPGLFQVPQAILPPPRLALQFGPTQAGGASLEWIARLTGHTVESALATLSEDPPLSAILFRPYLAGERAPYWDHSLTASFEGLRLEHNAADLILAVLQGVALQERLVLRCAEGGTRAETVVLAGGGARHAGLNRLRANILQRPVLVMDDPEASLRGAALLGWAGLGEIDLAAPPASWLTAVRIDPDPACSAQADALMTRFSPLSLAPARRV